MDPFQIRLECLQLVRRLTASQQSINKVVDFAVKYATIASDDVWDCILSECAKASLNARLNILFLFDALLISIVDPIGYSSSSSPREGASTKAAGTELSSSSTEAAASSSSAPSAASALNASRYLSLARKDLARIVDSVVPPENLDAVRFNVSSVQKVLQSWKRIGVFNASALSEQLDILQSRKEGLPSMQLSASSQAHFSKNDILRRIEEDRERHKRLRERAWILPAKSFTNALPIRLQSSRAQTSSLLSSSGRGKVASASPASITEDGQNKPDALTLEFDDAWETVSDLNEDDFENMREIDKEWWGGRGFAERYAALQQQLVIKDETLEDSVSHVEEQEARERSPSARRSRDVYLEQEAGRRSPPANRWKRFGQSNDQRGGRRRSRSPSSRQSYNHRQSDQQSNNHKSRRSHHDHPSHRRHR